LTVSSDMADKPETLPAKGKRRLGLSRRGSLGGKEGGKKRNHLSSTTTKKGGGGGGGGECAHLRSFTGKKKRKIEMGEARQTAETEEERGNILLEKEKLVINSCNRS